VTQENIEVEKNPPSRIYIEFGQLSQKQRKVILSLLKDVGFAPEEIFEMVIVFDAKKGET